LNTRVCTLTVPRSGLERLGLTSSTSVSANSVSPWKTGAGWLSASVARFAALLRLPCVDVVYVQGMVVHGDQAEQVVVRLGHRLGRPVLVDGPHLELLEIAAVRMGARRLPGGLVSLDAHGLSSWQGR
jgi:hypothetical protein